MSHPAPITCLLVDDDELDSLSLSELIAMQPRLQLLTSCRNALEAAEAIRALQPQLVFCDIDMPQVSGIALLKTVREQVPMCIFVTAHPEYALDGFELSALDYILKPVTPERFAQSIKRVEEYRQLLQKADAYDLLINKEMLTIKQGHDKLRLPVHDVVYLEAFDDYTKLYTGQGSYITIGSLNSILEKMPEKVFVRIHRSYAVARNKITLVKKGEIHCGTLALPVGKTYRAQLEDF